MAAAVGVQPRVFFIDLRKAGADDGQVNDIFDAEEPGPQPIIEIVVIVGNIISQRGHLRLGAGIGAKLEIMAGVILRQRVGQRARYRAVMLGEALKGFPCQVQPVKLGVMLLQRGHNPDRLRVMVKAAVRLHARVKRVFTGMAKRGVAKVMRERHRFGQLFVQAQSACDGACHLCHLNRMGQPGAKMVTFMLHKHLGFVFQPPKAG